VFSKVLCGSLETAASSGSVILATDRVQTGYKEPDAAICVRAALFTDQKIIQLRTCKSICELSKKTVSRHIGRLNSLPGSR